MLVSPIKNMRLLYFSSGDVTQFFGENPHLYSRFNMNGHNGIDLVRPHGETMYAIEDGEVVEAKDSPDGYGIHLRFISDAKDGQGRYREWTYGHNWINLVKQGDKVKAGQAIALMGNTGFVVSGNTPFWQHNPFAGTHLHLGLRYVRKTRQGWAYPGSSLLFQVYGHDNGYFGSVDPVPLLMQAQSVKKDDAVREVKLTVISLANRLLSLLRK
jgi:murein DD-endopeptidase MepM/ murein hydrolase activator NlpD